MRHPGSLLDQRGGATEAAGYRSGKRFSLNAAEWLAMKSGVRHKQTARAGGVLKLASRFFKEAERGSQAGAGLRGGRSGTSLEPAGQAAWSQAHV